MRSALFIATCLWILSGPSFAFAAGEAGASVRQGEHLRVEASELRQQAETLRSEGQSGKANQLDRRADALDEKADKVDPPQWPPQ